MASPGSVILVGVGGIDADIGPINDSRANFYSRVSARVDYRLYPGLAPSLWMSTNVSGSAPLEVSNTKTQFPNVEMTLSAVEIRNASRINSASFTYPFAGEVARTGTVTTTGPAVLLAWWWGDGPGNLQHRAIPNNGFTVIDSVLSLGDLVQCCFAYKEVNAAGTYDVTWDMLADEGAMLWLVAVE